MTASRPERRMLPGNPMLEAMAEAKLQGHLKTLDNLNHAVDEAKRLEHKLYHKGLDENYNLVCRKDVIEVLSELEKETPAEVVGIFKSFLGERFSEVVLDRAPNQV